ncbi:bifunctional glutamate N-acetyltransferase/amino-acid acetyltransferase ArgJ [Acetonema longum]|uniref:Arginine biosynthesis bifunctional protein ArgJ n=1 Tax=Acetonema longum DSM 6540 TaxID=1009370 RepID=F7NF53_9FIRM|nr:bifunctional glutamate N-acetyltransferase/amino-acid acetyltransferase ArgJ [Acetonema longum]EGO65308.1 arginine biosynthesis bifunctional protein ArgJ [Acetonema longum DSM 6540]
MKKITGSITTPTGFLASGVKAGLKKSGKEDIAIIYSETAAATAAVFTTNTMAAAPVLVSRNNIKKGNARAIVINSGSANAGTGDLGLKNAEEMVKLAAGHLNLPTDQVLVASTGVIGVQLPMDKIAAGIAQAKAGLSVNGGENAMLGIMTTDTFRKVSVYEQQLGGKTVRMAGIAKGAGMIHPNMATTLCFVTTDAAVAPAILDKAWRDAINLSFHMITVDGDTSTNDMAAVMANGAAGNKVIDQASGQDYELFYDMLKAVCTDLAKLVVKDGEGATKFLEITVSSAPSFAAAKTAAMAIAKSPLVKTAFFGQDPNWGRILCAVGYSGAQADPAKTSLMIGGVPVVKAGLDAHPDHQTLKKVMAEKEIKVEVELGLGKEQATVWTCDFSYGYIKINAEYHT